jgi:hypothetical protein
MHAIAIASLNMPDFPTVALVFITAHVIVEFVPFGTARQSIDTNKAVHGLMVRPLVFYLLAFLLTAIVAPTLILSVRYQLAALALAAVHVSLHRLERMLQFEANARRFVLSQLAHIAVSIPAAMFVVPSGAAEVQLWLYWARSHRQPLLSVITVYTVVVFGAGKFIGYVMRPLLKGLAEGEGPEQLENAGLYIGWLERFLVVTALILQSPSTLG